MHKDKTSREKDIKLETRKRKREMNNTRPSQHTQYRTIYILFLFTTHKKGVSWHGLSVFTFKVAKEMPCHLATSTKDMDETLFFFTYFRRVCLCECFWAWGSPDH